MRTLDRRSILRALAGSALALPLSALFTKSASGDPPPNAAKRLIVFYFPDGVPEPGGQHLWHPGGSGTNFTLSTCLQPLASRAQQCAFFRNLSLGPTDAGSHPGGAKKLLTGVDGGYGQSLDQYLSQTAGASAPWHHLYLGAQTKKGKDAPLAADAYISYPSSGQSITPEDNPLTAFNALFGQGVGQPGQSGPNPLDVSVIDGVLDDMKSLQARLGDVEKTKLDLHMEALRETEKRIKSMGEPLPATCDAPVAPAIDEAKLYDPAAFPAIMQAQMDLMVLAMACGLTKVGTIQASYHTSELLMSRFEGTDLYTPGNDTGSHKASHYGTMDNPLYPVFVKQVRFWMGQLAYLLGELAKRPDGDGTMLDTSLVVCCTEVSDGNTHSHDNMPFVLAGRANGRLSTGRALSYDGVRHSNLLSSIAHAMGQEVCFGQECGGPLSGLLS